MSMWPTTSYNPASYYTPSYGGGYSSYGSTGQGYNPYGSSYSSYGGYNPYGGGYNAYSSYGGYGSNSYNPYGSYGSNPYQQAGYQNPYGYGGYDDFSTQAPAPAPAPEPKPQQPPLDLESLFGPQQPQPKEPEKKSGGMGKIAKLGIAVLGALGLWKIANLCGIGNKNGGGELTPSDKTVDGTTPTFVVSGLKPETIGEYLGKDGQLYITADGTAQKLSDLKTADLSEGENHVPDDEHNK